MVEVPMLHIALGLGVAPDLHREVCQRAIGRGGDAAEGHGAPAGHGQDQIIRRRFWVIERLFPGDGIRWRGRQSTGRNDQSEYPWQPLPAKQGIIRLNAHGRSRRGTG